MENPDWYAVRASVKKAVLHVLSSKNSQTIQRTLDDNWIQACSIWPSEQRDKARAALVTLAKRKGYIKEP